MGVRPVGPARGRYGLGVAKDLVGRANGHLIFGDAVARVADSLSPLGAAARIVAESCALVVDMREINLEQRRLELDGRRVDNDRDARLAVLADRRAAVTTALRQIRSDLRHAEVSARDLRETLKTLHRDLNGARSADKALYAQLMETVTQALVTHHTAQGGALAGQIDNVLNGEGAVALARSSTVDTPASGRSARSRRRR